MTGDGTFLIRSFEVELKVIKTENFLSINMLKNHEHQQLLVKFRWGILDLNIVSFFYIPIKTFFWYL